MRSKGNNRQGNLRTSVALAVGLILISGGPLAAAPRASQAGKARVGETVAQAWLGTLWGWLQGAWEEAGAAVGEPGSPESRSGWLEPTPVLTQLFRDQGASIDPLGKN